MPSISPSTHASLQFLNSVLSQRGPNPLPYEETLKWYIRQHLVAAIEAFPGLRVQTAIFTHNDGRTVNLLQAHGTIPMLYKQVKYNIPLTLWLLESYPLNPPLVYVTPTRDMIIKPRHRFVNASGLVSVGFLQQWIFPRCNLAEFLQNLSQAFGEDPPLYSRPASPRNFSASLQKVDSPAAGAAPSPSSLGASNASGSPRPRMLPPSPQHSSRAEDPSEVFRRNAVNRLTDALQKDLSGLKKSFEREMEELFKIQALLDRRSHAIAKGVDGLKQEKEELEQQLQLLLTNTDVLESWLRSNPKPSTQAHIDDVIDDVIEPADVLSKQLLELRSSDLAIEDLLYSLDQAAQDGSIAMNPYLKNVRTLSREQFFLRASALKVRAVQLQLQAFGSFSHARFAYAEI